MGNSRRNETRTGSVLPAAINQHYMLTFILPGKNKAFFCPHTPRIVRLIAFSVIYQDSWITTIQRYGLRVLIAMIFILGFCRVIYVVILLAQVLSDPNRRRQYDLSGGDDETQNADFEPMNMEEIGNVGRVLGALVGKLGVPIPTSIAQSSLSEAAELCQNRGLTEDNPRLLPMKFGVEYKVCFRS